MSLVYTYDGSTLTADIPPTKVSLPQRAELGSISMGGISPEDPAASLALVGHRPFYVEETDCSQPRLFTGWVTIRNVGRSFEQTQFVGADARIHDTTITDLNALFGFRIITGADGNRPSETIGVRLTWLLASSYLTGLIDDTGKVTYPAGTPMEPADYRGSFPADVMGELLDLTQTPVNWFAFWDPAPSTGSPRCGLYFDNVGAAANICTISVSNVLADVNGTTVFAPNTEARLETTPETVYSDVIVEYLGASVFRNLAATETAHIKRGTKISRPRTGKVSTATAQADAYLASHANEVDRITPTIHVPSSVVGLLWAGQRMDVKFSHLPGYTSWTSMQIVASNPRAVDDLAQWYDVDLELVAPRVVVVPGGGCAGATASGSFWPLGSGAHTANVVYYHPGGFGWNFPVYGAGGAGTVDIAGSAVVNQLYCIVVGPGTITVHTVYEGDAVTISASLIHDASGGNVTAGGEYVVDSSQTAIVGTAFTFVVPNDGICSHAVLVGDWVSGCHIGFSGFDWVSSTGTTGGTIPPKPGLTTVATTDPAATDDSDHGYIVGVHWVNETTGQEYALVDSTTGAAVWVSTTAVSVFDFSTSDGVTTVDPTTELTFVGATIADLGGGVAELTMATPPDADYLVGTAQAGLSAEIVVGATPGGELGGTWASPTVDATHSGSAHLALGATSTTAAPGDHDHWHGAWSDATAYIPGDMVTLDGASWVCVLANTALMPMSPDYREAMVGTVPLSYWRVGEADPSTMPAADVMGANAGTYVGSPTSAAGLLTGDSDTAVAFVKASQQSIALPTTTGFPAGASPRTFACWFREGVNTNQVLWFYGTNAATQLITLYIDTAGHLNSYSGSGGPTISTSSYAVGTHFLSVTYSGTQWQAYIDGATAGPAVSETLNTVLGGVSACMGWNGASAWMDGTIDEPAIWDRAVTPAEVAGLHAVGTGTVVWERYGVAAAGAATYVDPASGTAADIINALIAAGLMAAS